MAIDIPREWNRSGRSGGGTGEDGTGELHAGNSPGECLAFGDMKAHVEAVGNVLRRGDAAFGAGDVSAKDDIALDCGAAHGVATVVVVEFDGAEDAVVPELDEAVLGVLKCFETEPAGGEIAGIEATIAVELIVGEDGEVKGDGAQAHLAFEGASGGECGGEGGKEQAKQEHDDGHDDEQFSEREGAGWRGANTPRWILDFERARRHE